MSPAASRVRAAIDRLAELEEPLGRPTRFLVAFSGGLDSTVLLDFLAEARLFAGVPVEAVHVNHGLQDDAGQFAEFCQAFASGRAVELTVLDVDVDMNSGAGVEAAARTARYAGIESIMQPGDWVVSAHHANDQVETLLLNLLRGSGPDGLAAMPLCRRLGPGWLVRPLLDIDREVLEDEAGERELDWVEDTTNAAVDFDRNFLRHEVLPVLARRWPNVVSRLLNSVERARDAREILAATGEADLLSLGEASRLDTRLLSALSPARRRNVVRTAVRQLGLPLPPLSALDSILADLVEARPDAEPIVAWRGAEARRYRDTLYLMKPLDIAPSEALPLCTDSIDLPAGLGRLVVEPGVDALFEAFGDRPLTVDWRKGGEALRLVSDGPTRKLKSLLQEAAVVPWMRDRLPLIFAGDELVAVADLFVGACAKAPENLRIRWLDGPSVR